MIPHYNCCSFHSTLIPARTCGQIMISRSHTAQDSLGNEIWLYDVIVHPSFTFELHLTSDSTMWPWNPQKDNVACKLLYFNYIFTTRQRSWGKVMFSVVSVCSQEGGSHVNITHDTLDLTVHAFPRPPRHQTWESPRPHPPGPLNIRHGTLLAPSPKASDIWWPLKNVRLASRRYVSYWNVFL